MKRLVQVLEGNNAKPIIEQPWIRRRFRRDRL
jgi:hypothetical protein